MSCLVLELHPRPSTPRSEIKCCSRINTCQKTYSGRWSSAKLFQSMIGFQSDRQRVQQWESRRLIYRHHQMLKAFPFWMKMNPCHHRLLNYLSPNRMLKLIQLVVATALPVKAQLFRRRQSLTTFRCLRQPFQCAQKSFRLRLWP